MRVVATAGHVDHGKSSLVRALTGTDPDRWEEERRRGLTIDLGFAHTQLPGGDEVSFVDVPGHVRFLRNMLAGVGAVDACLFVVAATEGWKPQSEEHLRILELLGLRHGLIALTKRDLVDGEWCELQAMDVRDRVVGTLLADAPIVPVSSTTGAGLDDLCTALAHLVRTTPAAADLGRPRLWVDRAFAAKGSGTVVTGTLIGGAIAVDERLDLLPAGRVVRIRGIQSHGEQCSPLGPGNRAALNLAGVDHHEVGRGDVVVRATQWRPTRRVDASLDVLASLQHVVSRRGAYVAYLGSGEHPVRVRVLGAESIAPGGSGLVRLHLDVALPLVPGDRYVLRESGRSETVGGGEVLDVAPVLPASRAAPDRRVERVVAERGWVALDDLEALTGRVDVADVADVAEVADVAGAVRRVGRWAVDPSALDAVVATLRDRIDAAGPTGLDTAALDERERAVLETLDGVRVEAARAVAAGAADPYADHPVLALLAAGGAAPPEPAGVARHDLRELQRRGLLVERDGIWFHHTAIDAVAAVAAALLRTRRDGFTVSELREALGVSRKYAVPLAAELDARGITRRRADLRIPGPRLPGGAASAPDAPPGASSS
jgi:selenocysteine-specific elongation factor